MKKSPSTVAHASAKHKPDIINLIWQDIRLCSPNQERNNKNIFLKAAARLFEVLLKYKKPQTNQKIIDKEKRELTTDLSDAIGETTTDYCFMRHELFENQERNIRINNYISLSKEEAYGGEKLNKYDLYKWFDDVIKENVNYLRIRRKNTYLRLVLDFLSERLHFLKDEFTWKDNKSYQSSNWYKFQEAVKELQEEAESHLRSSVFDKMELENW